MLLDIRFLLANAPLVAATVVAIVIAKMLVTAVPAWLAGFPVRTSLLAGAGIAQVGEFSFVLGSRGAEAGLLDAGDYQTFLAAAVVTMAATPVVTATLPGLLSWLTRHAGWARRLLEMPIEQEGPALADHVVIAGFGLNGQNLAAALGEFGVPHVILELNPETVPRAAGGPRHPLRRLHPRRCARTREPRTSTGLRDRDLRPGEHAAERTNRPGALPGRADPGANGAPCGGRRA
jgi:CPA2 family monovalent cation:H+ antiporter-2